MVAEPVPARSLGLPCEMLATAERLRHCRWQTAYLSNQGTLNRQREEDVEAILDHAIAVADALESLAQRLITRNREEV